jgi:hypothetical protein
MKSSSTVTALVLQVEALKRSQDEMRGLILDVLKEMLTISQAQAEGNLRFTRMLEDQTAITRATLPVGPGMARTVSDSDDYRTWRESLPEPTDVLAGIARPATTDFD